ncbi:hypothetical protein PPACK8108_LOCUS15399 [Phakopsora pachyrhizi]|uniref:Uncharacterized protein n=1 Tax=Phakopsora pachyrhizi TaxID=170000 RepID=A0AAV0BA31_PHAPC|nr:hypothetical protein PPACK8108_LOCUS15399 [Phakopsora pachyrhizi]
MACGGRAQIKEPFSPPASSSPTTTVKNQSSRLSQGLKNLIAKSKVIVDYGRSDPIDLNQSNSFEMRLRELFESSSAEIYNRGLTVWKSVYDPLSERLSAKLSDSNHDLPNHIVLSHYGHLLSDPAEKPGPLGRVATSLVAIGALCSLNKLGSQLLSHVLGLKKAFNPTIDGTEDQIRRLSKDSLGDRVDWLWRNKGSNGIDGEVLDNLKSWVDDWEGDLKEWFDWSERNLVKIDTTATKNVKGEMILKEDYKRAQTICDTPHVMSPEIIKKESYNFKSDWCGPRNGQIQGIKPPNQSSITDKSKSNKEQDDLTIEIDQEIHTGPGLKMPPGKGRRARWKAGKELHSKATECHESAIQAQGKYEKE